MGKQRKNGLDQYRLVSQDEGFKTAMQDTLKRMLRIYESKRIPISLP